MLIYKWRLSDIAGWVLASLIIVATVARVVSTYAVFSHTYDEPTHIYAGLQLLDTGDYTYQRETPPLARVLMAVGPYLDGSRYVDPSRTKYKYAELTVLYNSGPYELVLSLARLGNIPFLILLLIGVCIWTKQLFGMTAAVVSVAALATVSPILGHAALATTDMACAATVLITFFIFMKWLESRSWGWTLLLGLSSGIAIMVKFSAIPFFASGMAAVLLWRMSIAEPNARIGPITLRSVGQYLSLISVALAVFWLSYGLTDPLQTAAIHEKFDAGGVRTRVEQITGKETLAFDLLRGILTELPFPVFVRDMTLGFKMLANHNAMGHWNYLFGEINRDGWWYYYLVALAVKTPVPLLLLGIYGLCFTTRQSAMERNWRPAMPALCFVAILLAVSVTSRINSGVRHILILYPLMAIAAGALVSDVVARSKHRMMGISAVLLLWQATGSIAAHPDYMADFNFIAGKRPERILIDSDLDWGQDLKRLKQEILARKIERPAIAYYGNADVTRHIPNHRRLEPFEATTGWVAVSISNLATKGGGYEWVARYQPIARIGRSINLYFIGDNGR